MNLINRYINIALLAIIFAIPASFANAYEYKFSSGDKAIFKNALAKTKRDECGAAITEASHATDKVIEKSIKWLCYQNGYAAGGFNEIANFVEKNQYWPSMKILRNKAELALTGNEPSDDIVKYFTELPPVTGHGMRILADVKLASGDAVQEAIKLIKQSWQQGDFGREEEDNFLRDHGKYLTQDDYYNRVDRMLWEGDETGAKRLYSLLTPDHKRIVQARLQIMENNPGAIARLPDSLRNDPAIIYAEAKLQNDRENYSRVYQILYTVVGTMPNQEKWWKLKNRLVRELLDQNKIKEAYYIAKNHGNEKSSGEYSDSEWLAGWIALRYLGKPDEAYPHFYNMYNSVELPISISRAAYWAGRAAQARHNDELARQWYDISAGYPSTFYGQLSFMKIRGEDEALPLPESPEMGLLAENSARIREMLMAAYLFESSNQSVYSERFMKSAIDSVETASEMSYICEFGTRIGRPNLAVVAAKQALTKGVVLVTHGWPQTKHMPKTIGIEKPLALSIIRQESVFNPNAMSPANAFGLMQLIPATAKRMAKEVGVNYNSSALLTNPQYNITLGSHYLGSLVDNFEGSYILAIASYNAGPGNARKWIKKYNDPRQMKNLEDVIDWMESIPFNETRNYVQRVLENVQVYRSEFGDTKLTIEDDLRRGSTIPK